MLPPPGSPQYSVFGATPLCGQGSRRSPAPQDTPATPRGPLTCGDGTGTQCRPAPALCPGPWAGPCPAAPWDLGRQAGFAVPTGKTEQRGRGLGAFGADWAGEGGHEGCPVPSGCRVEARGVSAMGLRPEVCDIGAHLEGQPPHHHPHPGQIRSPTCRLAENWKMAVTGAVNRPEARLRPDPRRKAPWAAG